jgi:predicted deacylase
MPQGENPLDLANINRLFPGRRYGTFSEQLAYAVHQEITLQSDAFFDLHSASAFQMVPPHVGCQRVGVTEVDDRSEALARLFDIELINVMGKGIDSLTRTYEDQSFAFAGIPNQLTAVGNAALAGIPAVLLEAGGGGTLNPALVEIEVQGLLNVMRHLGIIEGPVRPTRSHRLCYGMYLFRTKFGGLFFPAVQPGDMITASQHLGVMKNLRGEVLASFTSPLDAVVLMLFTTPVKASGETLINLAVTTDPQLDD